MDPHSPDPERQWCSRVSCNVEDQEFMEDLVSLPPVYPFFLVGVWVILLVDISV